jgi:hypothetical protein
MSFDEDCEGLVRFELPSPSLNRVALILAANKQRFPILVLRYSGAWNSTWDSFFVRWSLRELEYLSAGILVADFSDVEILSHAQTDSLAITGDVLAYSSVFVVASDTSLQAMLRYPDFKFFRSFDDACSEAERLAKGGAANPAESKAIQIATPLAPVPSIAEPVKVECYALQRPPSPRRLVVLRLVGSYPRGASGAASARIIKWNLERFTDALAPTEVVVDVRELNYEWGDDLFLAPSKFSRNDSRIRMLVTPDQVKILAGTAHYALNWRSAVSDLGW